MRWLIGAMLLPGALLALVVLVRRSLRSLYRAVQVEQARDLFRLRREWLEARFLDELGRIDPVERLRWEDAHWHDEVIWARDRQTGRLLALIGVHFDADLFDAISDAPHRHSTVVFEFHRGRWRADGRRLDEVRPHEAFLRNHRFEPVTLPQRRD
jgi:hypothetical protein